MIHIDLRIARAALMLALGFAPTVAQAEMDDARMYRSGTFAESVSTPGCDGVGDTLSKYGGRALNAATALNPVRNIYEFAAAGGDPGRFLDSFKSNVNDAKSFAGDATEFALMNNPGGVVNIAYQLSSILPDGNVKDFMRRGRSTVAGIGRDSVESSIDTVQNDLTEAINDGWAALENIDDPERFFGEIGNIYQKYNPVGAVSLIFTSDSIEEGMSKAVTNLDRQADLAATYLLKKPKMGGYSIKPTKQLIKDLLKKQLKNHAVEAAKAMIGRSSPSDGAAIAATVAAFVTEVDLAGVKHPLHSGEVYLKNVPMEWMGDDYESGAWADMSGWHPQIEDGSDCISVGDTILNRRGAAPTGYALCGTTPGDNWKGKDKWWSRPIDMIPIWNDSCSGGAHNRSIWLPKCKPGHVAVGMVLGGEGSTKPMPNRVACLRMDPRILRMSDGVDAGLQWTFNDEHSGAKSDVTVYTRRIFGQYVIWAVPGYPARDDRDFVRSIQLPVAMPRP